MLIQMISVPPSFVECLRNKRRKFAVDLFCRMIFTFLSTGVLSGWQFFRLPYYVLQRVSNWAINYTEEIWKLLKLSSILAVCKPSDNKNITLHIKIWEQTSYYFCMESVQIHPSQVQFHPRFSLPNFLNKFEGILASIFCFDHRIKRKKNLQGNSGWN